MPYPASTLITRSFNNPTLRLLLGTIIISASPILVRLANVAPTTSAFYRLLIGGSTLAVVVIIRRPQWLGRHHLILSIVAGLFLALNLALWHRSIHYIGPGLATILVNLQVIFVAGFGIVFLRERLTMRFVLAIVGTLAGLLMIFGPDWEHLDSRYRLGVIWGGLAAFNYGTCLLILRRAQQRAGRADAALPTVAILSLIAAAISAFFVGVEGNSFHIPDLQSWAALLALALGPQVVGWVLISISLPHIEAMKAGLILMMQPALAFVWDVLIFDKGTTFIELTGIGLVLVAIFLGSTKGRAQARADK